MLSTKKSQGIPKGKTKHTQDKKQSLELSSDMIQMLELSEREFKITAINMLNKG